MQPKRSDQPIATRDFHGCRRNWLETYVPNVLAVRRRLEEAARENLSLDKVTFVVVGDLPKIDGR